MPSVEACRQLIAASGRLFVVTNCYGTMVHARCLDSSGGGSGLILCRPTESVVI